MNKNKIAIIALLGLTIVSSLMSKFISTHFNWFVFLVLGISTVKFIIVAFQFMELKKAHIMWKVLILVYLFIFITSITLIL